MGGRGASSGGYISGAIRDAKSGKIPVDKEDIQDIQNQSYGILTERLTSAERRTLANMARNSQNSQGTIEDIRQGNIAHINISQMSSSELETFARYAAKVSTTASQFAFNDALRLISWLNK